MPGSSRANIDRYLSGEVAKPPVEFFIAAARLLDVEVMWLLGITEGMTREEALVEEAAIRKAIQRSRRKLERELKKAA